MNRSEYEAIDAFHYSGLKTFAKCPRLYHEMYVAKTLSQEEKDYFLYGQLVDCLVTEPETLNERFVKVSRRSDGSTLDLEMKASELRAEMEGLIAKAATGNKVAQKGMESRQRKLVELEDQIRLAQESGSKVQVPTAIWDDAHETATEIQKLPLHEELSAKGFKSQSQFLVRGSEGIKRKGIVDLFYSRNTGDALKNEAIIVDIKTTYRLTDLDPLMYAGQLAYYKYIAEEMGYEVVGCYALVGDKGDRKLAQDFLYSNETLERSLNEVLKVEMFLQDALLKNEWPSAKSLRGRDQECFLCSECSIRPFSKQNEAVIV